VRRRPRRRRSSAVTSFAFLRAISEFLSSERDAGASLILYGQAIGFRHEHQSAVALVESLGGTLPADVTERDAS